MGERRDVYLVLVGKPEEKRSLGRPERSWKYIKIELQEIECGVMEWIYLAQDVDRWLVLVNTIMKLRGPLNAENFLTG
jgi:hypothetical protein